MSTMDAPGTTSSFDLHAEEDSDSDSDSSALSSSMSIDKLFPALLQCFGIILCGYVAGRTNIITSTQAKGLGNFVSRFALPALLFKNMVLLDFGNVIWPFLWSILVAKVSVFFIVCVLTLIVASPQGRYSKAGLYSIFATQSNDFALGYPIVEALYQSTYPEYLQYIYLVAPVSLMLLNPIGFALCEIQKWKNEGNHQHSKLLIVGLVVLQVLKNPIVFMVIIGIIAHFVLHQTIPAFMAEFLDGLSNSFGGAALFYLGLSMVGQLRRLTRSTVVTLILLLTAKLLLMPLICKDMVDLLDNSNISALNHSSLSNYAFLYGVFPTAPSVAIYAVYYNAELEVVTSGMVISTFLSAPIMYVSAWLLTIRWMDPQLLMNSLQNISFNISIVSLVALVWTIAVMVLSKKFKRLPHMFTVNLFIAQFLLCIGMILWNFVVKEDNFIGQILTFTLLCSSLYSTYMCCLWLLFNRVPGRLYLELQFFCAIVNYGQGLFSFALFGLDKHLIILPFKKRLYRLWHGKAEEEVPQTADLPEDIRMTCTQFTKYHKDQCLQEIVKKKRCGKRTMVDCFLGCELVNWLQQVGLAQDRGEAVLYGLRLQQGGVLHHIKQEYDFQDSPLYYRFTT
uniref:G protein-coupled receptor 155a n=1 Tax=Mastacembelus armatus TaxID=205130 RepID=A0A7N8WR64_9TELE